MQDTRWERSPGGGNSNPLQYSGLDNPTDRASWQATVHGVAESQTQLSIHAWWLHNSIKKKHWLMHSKRINFIILKLYLNKANKKKKLHCLASSYNEVLISGHPTPFQPLLPSPLHSWYSRDTCLLSSPLMESSLLYYNLSHVHPSAQVFAYLAAMLTFRAQLIHHLFRQASSGFTVWSHLPGHSVPALLYLLHSTYITNKVYSYLRCFSLLP